MQPTTIRVGQRLLRWDGVRGYVALNNSVHGRVYRPGEEFIVEWEDGESDYFSLESLQEEGVTRGRGVMPWAR